MKYNVDFEIAGSLIVLVIYIFLRIQYVEQSDSTRKFKRFVGFMFIAECLDIVTAITINHGDVVPVGVNIFLNTFYLAFSVVFEFQYSIYVHSCFRKRGRGSVMEGICAGIAFFYGICLIVNLFNGMIFSFDESGRYIHGDAYIIVFLIPMFYVIIAPILMLKNYKAFTKKQIFSVIAFAITATVGSVIQMVFCPYLLVSFFTISLGALMSMFALETPDYQLLMSTMGKLQASQREAEKASKAKGEFLANMSHEVRTPINAVLGYSDMILRETEEEDTYLNGLNIQAAGRTLLSMVNDILDYTDIDAGHIELNKEPYSTASFVDDVLIYGEYNAEKSGLNFKYNIDSNIPQYLEGDPVRLTQIINNLISNGIKYTKEGSVTLSIQWIETDEEKGTIAVDVTDTGIGMKPEDVANIEYIFTRFDNEKTRGIQGLGLGISIVSKLIHLMDGKLLVDSHYGEGTTFSFKVEQQIVDPTPMGEVKRNSRIWKNEADEDMFTAPNVRMLIADDNRMNLELLTGLLSSTRMNIDVASNGKEVISLVQKNNYDLIILDHMMPVMDGMEALRIIREEGYCDDVPIIVLTANAVSGARTEYLDAGFDEYLSKPVERGQLYRTIKRFLPVDSFVEISDNENQVEEDNENDENVLSKFSFLNIESGMAYCADSEEFYIEMIKMYLDNDRTEELNKYFLEENWEDYRITAHALKSTSLSIGADAMSELAKRQEFSVKEDRIADTVNGHKEFMDAYGILLDKIQAVFENKEQEVVETEVDASLEHKGTILVVDDDNMNIKIARHMLEENYDVLAAQSGVEALAVLEKNIPDLILLDLHMPGMSGFDVMEQLKANDKYKDIPVIFLTADVDRDTEVKGFKAGAMDFVTKPFAEEIVKQRVERILDLHRLQNNLEQEVQRQTNTAEERRQKVEQMSLQTVQTLANAIDAKDRYTNGHSTRVAEYSVLLAKEVGFKESEIENLRYTALLHDIGKIGVPDTILNKPGKLSETEYDLIKSHTMIGGDILKNITTLQGAENVARYHHENYDGKGYPCGLKGTEIPAEARIVCIADAYDAMNSKRVYRKSLPKDVIRDELLKGRGTQFDPGYLDAFLRLFDNDVLKLSTPIEKRRKRNATGELHQISALIQNKFKEIAKDKDFLNYKNTNEIKVLAAMEEDPGYLAVIDVDCLKNVNYKNGYKMGDLLLKLLEGILNEFEIQEGTLQCRRGDDEYYLFIRDASKDKATEIMDKLFARFREKTLEYKELKDVTLSVGLCKSTPLDSYNDIYINADKALYHVKQNEKGGYFFYKSGKKVPSEVKENVSSSYDFTKIYEYISDLQSQYNHNFELVMITLEGANEQQISLRRMEFAMECMEMAIHDTIREEDICVRNSNVQFLVVLMEAGAENINKITKRIFDRFYKNYGENHMCPSYSATIIEKVK